MTSLAHPIIKSERLPELDGLRACAILGVLIYHAMEPAPSVLVHRITGFGWAGVDLFFVISGFLIGGILLDRKGATNYYQVFYLRRFFRIVPLYALVIAPAVLIIGLNLQGLLKGHSISGTGWAVWLYPFFLQNIGYALMLSLPAHLGPAWSLAVEEQFYLLLPPLVRKLRPGSLMIIVLLAIASAPLLRSLLVWLFAEKARTACYALLPCRWDSLLLGVVCAYAVRDPRWRLWVLAQMPRLKGVWAVLGAGLIGMSALGWSQWDPRVAVAGYTWIALFFSATLLIANLDSGGWLNRGLSNKMWKPIALVSYGLYLLQGPAAALVHALFRRGGSVSTGWSAVGINLLAMLVTVLAAAVSWKIYESRMLRFGHRFQYYEPEDRRQPGNAVPADGQVVSTGQS